MNFARRTQPASLCDDPAQSAQPMCAQTVHEILRANAALHPNAIALVENGTKVTYRELDMLSDRYSEWLAGLGVRQGDFVPVRLNRSVRLVSVILGALKLGAAYALTDEGWPSSRLRDVTEQLQARLLVADTPSIDSLAVPICSPPLSPKSDPAVRLPEAEVTTADAATIFFTSGTTGRPKGVISPHSSIIRLFDPGTSISFGPDTVIALTAAQPWDVFSLELWGPLLCGGTTVIIDEPYLSGDLMRRLIEKDGLNAVWATSSLFNMLVEESLECFRGVRLVISGGERLSPEHVRTFVRAHPDIAVINGYGPVETTFATTQLIRPEDCDVPGGIPVGRPLPRTRVHVLNGTRQCADGEIGEICISGDGVALGYVGDPELTGQKFVTLPIAGRAERVYRTGDLGILDKDGVLHFRGRADRQLKVRGFRVEPIEVEAVIERMPGVRSCVVLPHFDANAFCVGMFVFYTCEQPCAGPEALQRQLRDFLASYQIPDRLIEVAAIPLLSNGKIDNNALLALAEDRDDRDYARQSYRVPIVGRDDLTRKVAEVVASVVGMPADDIPGDVAFAALGATSLDMGRIAMRLGGRIGCPVPLSQVFRTPTVTGLGSWIRSASMTASDPDIEQGDRDGAAPLSEIQTMMALGHFADPEETSLHCLLAWRVSGRPDRLALRRAFAYLHRRHRSLSSVYSVGDRAAVTPADVPPPAMRESLVATEADALVELMRELALPFHIGEGDVWRPVLVAARDEPVTLIGVAVHHIAFDGASASVFAQDLAHAYNTYRILAEPSQPATLGVAGIAAARDAHLRYVDLDAQRDHWHRTLTGIPTLRYPQSNALSALPGTDTMLVSLGGAFTRGVAQAAAQYEVSPFVVCLAGYAQTLAELTGQVDFGIGTPFSQRGHVRLSDAVSCLINILCLRPAIPPDCSPTEAITRTASVVSAAFAAHDIPTYECVEMAEPEKRADGRPRLFQTMFTLQDHPTPNLALNGSPGQFVIPPYPEAPTELLTEFWPLDDDAQLAISYRTDRVPTSFCQRVADKWVERIQRYIGG